MHIQYVGFKVLASSRIYNFGVIDSKEAREFTVAVQAAAFRPAGLKLQDGPGICFERLEQELEAETQESRAEAHLSIGERDIQEYLEGQYPRQPLVKKTASYHLTVGPNDWCRPAGLTAIELNAPCNRKQSSPLRRRPQ